MTRDTVVLFKGSPYTESVSGRVPLIPLSLICLSSSLKKAGFRVVMLDDCNQIEKIAEIKDKIVCVGISALTSNEITDGIEFSKEIREIRNDIPVVWGGWHVSILPEESVKSEHVDIVVFALGQEIFTNLAECIRDGGDISQISGIYYYENGVRKTDVFKTSGMDKNPLPDFEALDLEYYRKHSLMIRHKPTINGIDITGYLYYITSFGCPNLCTYCCSRAMFGPRIYKYGLDKVADQIKWLVEEKGFNSLGFMDANFFIDINRVKKLCELLIEKNVKFAWDAQMYPRDIIRYEKRGLMALVKKAGCFRVNIGAESGSQEILDYIKKHVSVEEIVESAKILTKHNIDAAFNLLFGLPKVEDKRHLYETFNMAAEIKKINPDFVFPISFYVPFPGTPMYNDAIEKGLIEPKTLDEWGKFDTNYATASDNFPWRNKKLEKLVYMVMIFYMPLAFPGNIYRGTLRNMKERASRSLFVRLASWVARQRVKFSFYHLPFEYMLFKAFERTPYVGGGAVELNDK